MPKTYFNNKKEIKMYIPPDNGIFFVFLILCLSLISIKKLNLCWT